MSLHRQPAAWLLGLEGIALLRHGAGDDLGSGFVEVRLAEVRRIVDAIDDETPLVDIGDISLREGYATWAASYDGEDNPLFGPDQAAVRPLLDALAVGRIADVAAAPGATLRISQGEATTWSPSISRPRCWSTDPVAESRPICAPYRCPTTASTPPSALSP